MSDTDTSSPVLLVLAGPAGSGKTTLSERLVAEQPGVERVVTATTRSMRPGEINGVHYHFLSEAQFDEALARGEFLEWACVHGRNRYGTLRRAVVDRLAAGMNLVIAIDVQGVRSVRAAAEKDELLRRAAGAHLGSRGGRGEPPALSADEGRGGGRAAGAGRGGRDPAAGVRVGAGGVRRERVDQALVVREDLRVPAGSRPRREHPLDI